MSLCHLILFRFLPLVTWILGRSGLSADAGECTRIWHMLLYRTCDGCSWRRELFNPFWVLWLDSCFDGPEDSEECVGATDGGPTFLRNFRLQCVVDAKSLYDHLVSLSSPSSMEDKRCGFDLVISRQCMQRLGATIRWAPTNRQLADALTKDAADPVDLLRSCMRCAEYQLSPEFSSERQQNDPGVSNDKRPLNLRHYRVSHPSHQMLSWFNQGSV